MKNRTKFPLPAGSLSMQYALLIFKKSRRRCRMRYVIWRMLLIVSYAINRTKNRIVGLNFNKVYMNKHKSFVYCFENVYFKWNSLSESGGKDSSPRQHIRQLRHNFPPPQFTPPVLHPSSPHLQSMAHSLLHTLSF